MALLIDGYNLLHASGILARGIGPATLERSRHAMLNFLAESLEAAILARTIVVFDAGTSATGRVRSGDHRGMQVRFSAGKADADDLIEELIRADSAPRRLTVVSSDHRIQRAAHRRKALAIDSDKWFAGVLRSRSERAERGESREPQSDSSSAGGLAPHEVQYWLGRFGIEDATAENSTSRIEPRDEFASRGSSTSRGPSAASGRAADEGESPPNESGIEGQQGAGEAGADEAATKKPPARRTKNRRPTDRTLEDKPGNLLNPFPPGYAEDVFEDE